MSMIFGVCAIIQSVIVMKNLYETLQPAQTEEELKNLFAKFFALKLDTKNYIDLYTPQILFEFKFDENLNNLQARAKCFAQTLYAGDVSIRDC